jgi:hypothetical protein
MQILMWVFPLDPGDSITLIALPKGQRDDGVSVAREDRLAEINHQKFQFS